MRHFRSDRRRPRLQLVIFRRDAKVKLISEDPVVPGLLPAGVTRVAGIMSQLDEPEGKVLIREGEPGRDFFVLAEGTAEVRKGNRRVSTLGPGDFAGEIALLTNAPRTATVRTTSPVTVLCVTSKGSPRCSKRRPRFNARSERRWPTASHPRLSRRGAGCYMACTPRQPGRDREGRVRPGPPPSSEDGRDGEAPRAEDGAGCTSCPRFG